MIGLGSNRLTVCRRGGMSVTQAGRGGMEWLAGGRGVSPYSDQATAALKAQFPTQWPTIRDYGFAHPEIVPYVNQDYLVVCSFGLPGMPIRFLVGNGTAYFNLDYTANARTKCKTILYTETMENKNYFGGASYNVNAYGAKLEYRFGTTTWSSSVIANIVGTPFTLETTTDKLIVNGNVIDTISMSPSYEDTLGFSLFVRRGGSAIINAKIGQLVIDEINDHVRYYVPYLHNNNVECLDIVRGNLQDRHGTFTIGYMIYENGQWVPWTPPPNPHT